MASTDEKQGTAEETHDLALSALARSHSHPSIETGSTRSQHRLSGIGLVLVIFALCLAQFLAALDITIVATALPTIANQVGVTSSQYT